MAETFIVQGKLLHDRQTFTHGQEITLSDPERIAELRRLGAIKLPNELAAPQTVADQLAEKDSEIASLREKLAALEAQAKPEASGKGK